MKTISHVLSCDFGLWQIKFEIEPEARGIFGEKSPAVEMAHNLTKRHGPSRLVVHKVDGTVEYEYSYAQEYELPGE